MNLVLERMSFCYPCQCGHWMHPRIPFLFGVYFKADDCILYLLFFFWCCGFHLNVADFTFVFVHYVCFLFLCFLPNQNSNRFVVPGILRVWSFNLCLLFVLFLWLFQDGCLRFSTVFVLLFWFFFWEWGRWAL
jgi:hypothetical protein